MATNDLHKHLRKALNHLYNPDYLRTSPLAAWLGITGRHNTPKALQGIMVQGIETLKHRSAGARDERKIYYYNLLHYRYVEKLTQEEVANQLRLSTRQFAREQDHAVDLLAIILTEQYPVLASIWTSQDNAPPPSKDIDNAQLWRDFTPQGQPIRLGPEIETVLDLVKPLLKQREIGIEANLPTDLPNLAVHPVALRQVMLSLLTSAIHQTINSRIRIKAKSVDQMVQVEFQIEIDPGLGSTDVPSEDQESLDIARKLVGVNNGIFSIRNDDKNRSFCLDLPVFKYLNVLLIDDNPDFLQLVQRYTIGTGYQVVGAQDPSQSVDLAIRHSARFILLDVLMPNIDGWQVLSQLRGNPKTVHIPVIICTILAQEELAYALGASAFLRKPLSQTQLIETLHRLSNSAVNE